MMSSANIKEKSNNMIDEDLLDLDLNKIRDFINIMEEHEMKLEKNFEFAEAAIVREKINTLKLLEEEKVKSDLRKIHEDEKSQIDLERQIEFRGLNEEYDNLYADLIKRFEDLQSQMSEQHRNEYDECLKAFEETFPDKNPKASPQILDLYKKLEGIVRRKDYNLAHEVHMRIIELTNTHNKKWNSDTKQWKLQCEINRIKAKQENEFNALKQNIDSTINEFNKKRQIENDKLEQKHKNRMKELLNIQKNQMNVLHSPSKNNAIKSDRFKKTNNLKKKSITLTAMNVNTKSTTSNTEENSKTLK